MLPPLTCVTFSSQKYLDFYVSFMLENMAFSSATKTNIEIHHNNMVSKYRVAKKTATEFNSNLPGSIDPPVQKCNTIFQRKFIRETAFSAGIARNLERR